MSLAEYVIELRKKHEKLADKVEQAQKTLRIKDIAIVKMKKQKLRLKEEIY